MSSSNSAASLPPLLLDSQDAAQVLAISERTLWELTTRGEITAVRIGRAKRKRVGPQRIVFGKLSRAVSSGSAAARRSFVSRPATTTVAPTYGPFGVSTFRRSPTEIPRPRAKPAAAFVG